MWIPSSKWGNIFICNLIILRRARLNLVFSQYEIKRTRWKCDFPHYIYSVSEIFQKNRFQGSRNWKEKRMSSFFKLLPGEDVLVYVRSRIVIGLYVSFVILTNWWDQIRLNNQLVFFLLETSSNKNENPIIISL